MSDRATPLTLLPEDKSPLTLADDVLRYLDVPPHLAEDEAPTSSTREDNEETAGAKLLADTLEMSDRATPLTLLPEDKSPLTLADDVLRYLDVPPHLAEEEAPTASSTHEDDEDAAGAKLLAGFAEARARDVAAEAARRLEARRAAFNQRELADPRAFLGGELEEAALAALAFRETVVVAAVRDPGGEREAAAPVGGLCLDAQAAAGRRPARRLGEAVGARLRRVFREEGRDVVEADEEDTKPTSRGPEPPDLEDDVKTQRDRNRPKFLVHVSAQFDLDGANAGLNVTSWVDREFHAIEELRREFRVDPATSERAEKDLYVGMLPKYYYVKHTSRPDGVDDRKFYSFAKTSKFVSEGANYLLLRYLAVTRYMGCFEMSAMRINGDMCRNQYSCTGPESEIVNGQRVDICRIERTLIEESGEKHVCETILTLYGQLLRQEWIGDKYILMVNPKAKIAPGKLIGNDRLLLKHVWEDDMQLYSKYLDEKVRTEMKIKSYMIDNPEFKNIIVDYINVILLLKPEDILEFTGKHFTNFTSNQLPHNPYFE